MTKIHEYFRRDINRTIEKVIDYYAQEEDRLACEVAEYEVTDKIESCFRNFLDVFGEGVRGGQVTEVGIWVSGFYGSGKSSFTKCLGASLDTTRTVGGKPFLDLLCDRFPRNEIPAALRTVSKKRPTAVVLLDLGAEQLADGAAAPVSTVLYWKVLQWAGFSKEKKLARLEFNLERRGKYDEFKDRYRKRYNGEWEEIHNDPLIGLARAAEIVPEVLPDDFPTSESFRGPRFEEAGDVGELTREIIDICRRKSGHENILLLVDEAGQYVAPRGELILNLDGLARNLKELGKGKVWIAATGQQTLSEIVEKAAHNSAELNKLRDRFPISIHLDTSDIREITYRRLLDKSEEGRKKLEALFKEHGQSLVTHTRLSGTALFKGAPDSGTFTRLHPFLPQHFDLLLELIRTLARSTGGIGLRSAIRVIQDVLVDKSRVLGADAVKLADREIGALACVDDFYDTLRPDIAKVLPHVIGGVEKTAKIFGQASFETRVAKAVAALQPVETFPRTAENIAALLYRKIGSPGLLDQVREALRKIASEKECGLIEDPQAGGWVFLSDAVKPIRDKRNSHAPTSRECARAMLDSSADPEWLFAGAVNDLLSAEDRAVAEEVLSSERFFERLPELRGEIRAAVDRTEKRYTADRTAYEDDLKKARTVLETEPDWAKLSDEDREEIAAKLRSGQWAVDSGQDEEPAEVMRRFRDLLIARRTLPVLVEELKAEIKRRRPSAYSKQWAVGGGRHQRIR
ncbi:MAG: BREX system P-loop protein BrxC [Thermodesulfobacteriota bacterium]